MQRKWLPLFFADEYTVWLEPTVFIHIQDVDDLANCIKTETTRDDIFGRNVVSRQYIVFDNVVDGDRYTSFDRYLGGIVDSTEKHLIPRNQHCNQ